VELFAADPEGLISALHPPGAVFAVHPRTNLSAFGRAFRPILPVPRTSSDRRLLLPGIKLVKKQSSRSGV
jgi:hypothetical protein